MAWWRRRLADLKEVSLGAVLLANRSWRWRVGEVSFGPSKPLHVGKGGDGIVQDWSK